MNNFILDCYEEYKIFMGIRNNSLPSIKPIQIEEHIERTLAYVRSDEIDKKQANLYYNPILFKYNNTFVKAKLFHEFTHILDIICFTNKYSERQLETLMSLYSEYHASQVELAFNIGYENIHSTE